MDRSALGAAQADPCPAQRARALPLDEHQRRAYREALWALSDYGCVPGAALDDLAVRLAVYLLAKGPGHASKLATIAKALGLRDPGKAGRRKVKRRLSQLRAARVGGVPLVQHRMVAPLHHPLPWDEHTGADANLWGYVVAAGELLAAIKVARRQRREERAADRLARVEARAVARAARRAVHGPYVGTISGPDPLNESVSRLKPPSASASRSRGGLDPDDTTPSPSEARVASGTPGVARGGAPAPTNPSGVRRERAAHPESESAEGSESTAHAAGFEAEIDGLGAAWDALQLPERGPEGDPGGAVSRVGPVERATLRARVRQLGLAMVAAMIADAGACPWMPKGRARSAFALWFAPNAIERRLHEARKRLDRRRDTMDPGVAALLVDDDDSPDEGDGAAQ